jgi:endonuclease YncB( thermonuclease family)
MPRFAMRLIVSASLVLFGAIAAHAQVVTEVKTADRLMVHGLGEVRLLGVEGIGMTPSGERELQCAESARKMVYGLIHAREVRLVVDDKVKNQPALAMHRYLYLADGRMLNTVLLQSGCARLASGYERLQYGAMFKSVADHAQANNRGLYGASGAVAMPAAPATSASGPSGVTLAAFNRITLGMSFADVHAILGTGKETSRFESSSFTAASFQWDTSDGLGFIMISFQNGKVDTKNQFGLK